MVENKKDGKDKNLEEVMEERKKVVDNVFHKYLGVSIKELNEDITEKLNNPLLTSIIDDGDDIKVAKDKFMRYYIVRLLNRHRGNIQSASKEADVDRRTLHRMISRLGVDVASIRKVKKDRFYKTNIYDAVEDSLHKYESVIHPKKLDDIYNRMDEITTDIANSTEPTPDPTLKEAEEIFEAVYIKKILKKNSGNISRSAREMGIRYETLHRKIEHLKRKMSAKV